MNQIKDCPFCGSKGSIRLIPGTFGGRLLLSYKVGCQSCGIWTKAYGTNSHEEIGEDGERYTVVDRDGAKAAAEVWNKRV